MQYICACIDIFVRNVVDACPREAGIMLLIAPDALTCNHVPEGHAQLHQCGCNMLVQEVDELVREWKPEPLVPEKSAAAPRVTTPVIDQIVGPRVTIDGVSGILHLASHNFWGLAGDPSVQV